MVALRNIYSPITSPERHVSIMTYVDSNRQAIPILVDQREEISICLVDQSSGAVLTHGCFRYLLGPSRFVLVASEFSHLYYLVEGDKCTCIERIGCSHTQDAWLVAAIRGNNLVETPWCELTEDEQTEANNVLFAPCDLEARWEAAQW